MKREHRLTLLRILNGLTSEDLAIKANANRSSVVFWEHGRYHPSAKSVEQLSKVLGVSRAYLMFGEPSVSGVVWVTRRLFHSTAALKWEESICAMFPDFLRENGFNAAMTVNMSEGTCFLLRRNSQIEALLISPPKLAKCLLEAIQTAISEVISSSIDKSADVLSAEDLRGIIPAGCFLSADFERAFSEHQTKRMTMHDNMGKDFKAMNKILQEIVEFYLDKQGDFLANKGSLPQSIIERAQKLIK